MSELTNELTPQQTFEEGIKSRLRQDIGSLMPDAVLAQMVERSVKEMFFTKRITKQNYGREVVEPSWFEAEVGKLLIASMQTHVRTYFDANGEAIAKEVAACIAENGPVLLANLLISSLQNHSYNLTANIQNNLSERLSNLAKPSSY